MSRSHSEEEKAARIRNGDFEIRRIRSITAFSSVGELSFPCTLLERRFSGDGKWEYFTILISPRLLHAIARRDGGDTLLRTTLCDFYPDLPRPSPSDIQNISLTPGKRGDKVRLSIRIDRTHLINHPDYERLRGTGAYPPPSKWLANDGFKPTIPGVTT